MTLEINTQLELFPKNMPSHFRMHLLEMWSLDKTWEVGLFQFLLLQTWHNNYVEPTSGTSPPLKQSTPRRVHVLQAGT